MFEILYLLKIKRYFKKHLNTKAIVASVLNVCKNNKKENIYKSCYYKIIW